MITDNLRINQLSPAAYAWYLSYLSVLDATDLAAYGSFLADACTLQSNNNPPIVGKAAILEALNHYTRLDGRPVTLRAVACTDRNPAGAVIAVRFYTDTTPLFA